MSSEFQTGPEAPRFKPSPVLDPVRKHLCDLGAIVDGAQVRPLKRNDLEQLTKLLDVDHLQGVDLSGADMRGIDIRGMDLGKVIMKGCNLEGAIGMPLVRGVTGGPLPHWDMGYQRVLDDWHSTGKTPPGITSVEPTIFEEASLGLSNLSGSDLRWANMSGANLAWAEMEGSDFTYTNLQDANLCDAYFSIRTKFQRASWGKEYISVLEKKGNYEEAIGLYHRLMEWHESAGLREAAGKFYYRKKESQRKANLESLKKQLGELKHEAGKPLGFLRRQ